MRMHIYSHFARCLVSYKQVEERLHAGGLGEEGEARSLTESSCATNVERDMLMRSRDDLRALAEFTLVVPGHCVVFVIRCTKIILLCRSHRILVKFQHPRP